MTKPKIIRDTGFKRVPFNPGYMAIEINSQGREAGPISGRGCFWWLVTLPLILLALIVPLMLLFMFLQTLPIIGPILGVPQ